MQTSYLTSIRLMLRYMTFLLRSDRCFLEMGFMCLVLPLPKTLLIVFG